jgi:polar amino acid transport system substrate-binding protein
MTAEATNRAWPFVAEGKIEFMTDVGFPEPGFPPMQFHVDGELRGVDIDIGREIARRLGAEADFRDVPLGEMTDLLTAGEGDALICGLTDRADRRDRLTFVHYLRIGQTALVAKGNPRGITTAADLAGKSVVVYGESSNALSLDALDRENQQAGLPPIFTGRVYGTTGASTRVEREAVLTGDADADFIDVHSALWSASQHEALEVAPFVVNEEPAGIAFRKADGPAQEAVLSVVRNMYDDGTFQQILAAWNLERLCLRGADEVKVVAIEPEPRAQP